MACLVSACFWLFLACSNQRRATNKPENLCVGVDTDFNSLHTDSDRAQHVYCTLSTSVESPVKADCMLKVFTPFHSVTALTIIKKKKKPIQIRFCDSFAVTLKIEISCLHFHRSSLRKLTRGKFSWLGMFWQGTHLSIKHHSWQSNKQAMRSADLRERSGDAQSL